MIDMAQYLPAAYPNSDTYMRRGGITGLMHTPLPCISLRDATGTGRERLTWRKGWAGVAAGNETMLGRSAQLGTTYGPAICLRTGSCWRPAGALPLILHLKMTSASFATATAEASSQRGMHTSCFYPCLAVCGPLMPTYHLTLTFG